MAWASEGEVAVSTLVFDSDDLERTEDFLSKAYAKMRIGNSTPSANRARIRRDTVDSITVDELDLDFDMSYAVSPLGRICLCVVHTGTIEDHVFPGVEDSFGPGDVVSFAPPDLPYSGRIRGARYNITMLDPALLSQVAATVDRRTPQPVRLTGHRPHSAAAAGHLRRTISYVRDHALSDPAIADQPLIRATVSQLLAGSVLTAFPNTALTDPTASDRNDAHPGTLQRALSHIDDHAAEPLTVADIAAAAHVSIRALQYAFRRHLDTTPMAYVRRVRLAHAHHDLATAAPETATVADIATRWGFFHPARFAALYRETYRTTPGATLRS